MNAEELEENDDSLGRERESTVVVEENIYLLNQELETDLQLRDLMQTPHPPDLLQVIISCALRPLSRFDTSLSHHLQRRKLLQ
jgi:hypothetical protein